MYVCRSLFHTDWTISKCSSQTATCTMGCNRKYYALCVIGSETQKNLTDTQAHKRKDHLYSFIATKFTARICFILATHHFI